MRQHDCDCVGQLTLSNAAQYTADVGKRPQRERGCGQWMLLQLEGGGSRLDSNSGQHC